MLRAVRVSCLLLLLLALAGCGSGPRHPINPPSASIQQLDVLPDGRWKIALRVENFSDITVHYAKFQAALNVAGMAAADIALDTDLDVPGYNADVIETTLTPSADAKQAFALAANTPTGASYELKGTIGIPTAGKDFKFEHRSRLSPVPGIPNQYR